MKTNTWGTDVAGVTSVLVLICCIVAAPVRGELVFTVTDSAPMAIENPANPRHDHDADRLSLIQAYNQNRFQDARSQDRTFVHQGLLRASDGAANDNLGQSVAISGNTAIVGASQHDVGTNGGQGAA